MPTNENSCRYCAYDGDEKRAELCKECKNSKFRNEKFHIKPEYNRLFKSAKELYYPNEKIRDWENGSWQTYPNKVRPTKVVKVLGTQMCPYCGRKDGLFSVWVSSDPFAIRDANGYGVPLGYMCLCKGAQAEIDMNMELEQAKAEYEKKCSEIRASHQDDMNYDILELLKFKRERMLASIDRRIAREEQYIKDGRHYNYLSDVADKE